MPAPKPTYPASRALIHSLFPSSARTMTTRMPPSAEAKAKAEVLLADVLSSDKPILVRALTGSKKAAEPDEVAKFLRTVTLKACATMIDVALASGKGDV